MPCRCCRQAGSIADCRPIVLRQIDVLAALVDLAAEIARRIAEHVDVALKSTTVDCAVVSPVVGFVVAVNAPCGVPFKFESFTRRPCWSAVTAVADVDDVDDDVLEVVVL